MNTAFVLLFGALVLLAVSALLAFCLTEPKGKNTPHFRGDSNSKTSFQSQISQDQDVDQGI